MNVELYRADNILRKMGFLFILPALIALVYLGKTNNPGSQAVCYAIIWAPPVFFLVAYLIRRREKKYNSLLHVLDHLLIARTEELKTMHKFSESTINGGLKLFQELGLGKFVRSADGSLVYDARLEQAYAVVETCPACSAQINGKFRLLLLEIPKCPACGNPFQRHFWNAMINEKKGAFRQESLEKYIIAGRQKKSFSWLLAAILFIAFWPLGVWYVYANYSSHYNAG